MRQRIRFTAATAHAGWTGGFRVGVTASTPTAALARDCSTKAIYDSGISHQTELRMPAQHHESAHGVDEIGQRVDA